MRKKKNARVNYYRQGLQWAIVGLLAYMVVRLFVDKTYAPDFEAYCPFGGLQALSSYLASNSLACAMSTTQIVMGIVLGVGVLLISKLFCSYICPIGTFTEWLGRLGSRYKLRYTITGLADSLLRALKYILLFITFYFTVTSSELFCKQFDPYYAIFSGFDGDVTVAYAISAILITVLGSFFIRQFWCKYLCPLGAAANIFAFAPVFAGITFVYWLIIRFTSWELHWAWYLGFVCAAGLLMEILRRKGMYFPIMKITRSAKICTDCKICNKVCPYAIKVSEADSVKHIDCHMCVDCVVKCPEKGALTINHRPLRWLPAASVVILVVAGLLLAARWELPTIDVCWGSEQQFKNAEIYEQNGLKTVRCFGSSKSFAGQMEKVEGVLGVQTFARRFGIKIFYDPSVINASEIRKAIFTPVNWVLAEPSDEVKMLSVADIGIDRFFDSNDAFLLSEMLNKMPGVYGFETLFGEPVHARIYFNSNLLTISQVCSLIEAGEVTYMSGEEQITEDTEFRVGYVELEISAITVSDYLRKSFKPYDLTFNEFEKYAAGELQLFQVPFPQAVRTDKQSRFPVLMSHLSNDDGIVRFKVEWVDEIPVLKILYVSAITNADRIKVLLNAKQLMVHYPDGSTREFENPFDF
ncbi:MAG: 4Fe-4S binding protein [Bacteroidales bacterium]|nr:4Fe-4S binding protein [Bacteroidales bacterium]MDZ4204012.1 4Fe-4S binding protein [Bacteroidales bacterium]